MGMVFYDYLKLLGALGSSERGLMREVADGQCWLVATDVARLE